MRYFLIVLFILTILGCKNSTESESSPANQNKQEKISQTGDDTGFLKNYTNSKWQFSVKYPEGYRVFEAEIAGVPVVNIYSASNSYNPPLGIHEKADKAYLAVLPQGLGVDGPSGKRKKLSETEEDYFPELQLNKDQSIAYFLESGEPWAFFLNFQEQPKNWSEYAGVFVHFKIENFESICLDKNGNKVSMEDCAPPGDEHIILKGDIEKDSRDKLMQIVKSFSFKVSDTIKTTDRIKVEKPLPNMDVTSPLTIKGQALGTWFFEGSAPVQLVDKDGNELASKNIQVQGNWMTEDFVDFSGTMEFEAPDDERGYLVFWKANPSGKVEKQESYRLPVIFPPK